MAEEELLEGEQDDDVLSGSSGGRSKLITILLWVAGAIVGLLAIFLISYFVSQRVTTQAFKEEQNVVIAPAPPPLQNFKFQQEFRVNTADQDEAHFIQASLTLAFEKGNQQLQQELVQRQSQMMHHINMILGGKKKEELATPQQKINLAREIKSQINQILREGKIEKVYFEELVVS